MSFPAFTEVDELDHLGLVDLAQLQLLSYDRGMQEDVSQGPGTRQFRTFVDRCRCCYFELKIVEVTGFSAGKGMFRIPRPNRCVGSCKYKGGNKCTYESQYT